MKRVFRAFIGMAKGLFWKPARVAHLEAFREYIERLYSIHPTGCGGSFGELLCFEIHHGDQGEFLDYDASIAKNGIAVGCDFRNLAKKWGIPVSFLGELISHHCVLLED